MSGIGFAERVKLLLQKRLDHPKWPVGDSPPSAIRYLSDGQGNLICILTTAINPNDAEPIGPGGGLGNVGLLDSSGARISPSEKIDPFIKLADQFELPFSKTAEVYSDDIVIHARITSTNTDATFHKDASDYSVPTGKKARFYRMIANTSTAVVTIALGYGDDGVADGLNGPSTPVFFWGSDTDGFIALDVANQNHEIPISITVPAGKFPWMITNATSANKSCILFGVELDA